LHDNAEFVGWRALQRLAVAKNRVAAVNREMECITAFAKAFDDLLPRPGGNQVAFFGQIKVARPLVHLS
jgi:hypothetical protein